ncbi:hypothetical protein A2U01_0026099 [Trifolium medium]|uniref:Uncharacterized protein n=1 Tax=Trifolium medium TaxID=97028 RepID=A0A392P0K4_9FABA|nr:hypothetical protein [Trifolium medium]
MMMNVCFGLKVNGGGMIEKGKDGDGGGGAALLLCSFNFSPPLFYPSALALYL